MIIWVAEKCEKALGKKNVYVATDDKRIAKKANEFGFNSIMTSKKCLTGTDRLGEASKKIKSKIFINVQGDEPLVKPNDIKKIIREKRRYPDHVICGYTDIFKNENPSNRNIPKVVVNNNNELVYISRSVVPGSKNSNAINKNKYFKQVCIYAFNKKELGNFCSFKKKSKLEAFEDIEILRFFEIGTKIRMVKTSSGSLAVDEKKDIKKIEKFLKKK